jgi:DNA-3-methyladenine glycosylase II
MKKTSFSRALTPDEFERARRSLMRRDPRLGAVIKKVGRCGLPDHRGHEPFGGLVKVIASQQLSGKAAETIFGRVVALAGGKDGLTPERVKTLDTAALRAAGLSRPKISYLYDLADHVLDGRLDLHALAAITTTGVCEITAVKGLGRWSVGCF